jgi:hypothetical protein
LPGFDVSVGASCNKEGCQSIRLLLIGCCGRSWNRGHKTLFSLLLLWSWREYIAAY